MATDAATHRVMTEHPDDEPIGKVIARARPRRARFDACVDEERAPELKGPRAR